MTKVDAEEIKKGIPRQEDEIFEDTAEETSGEKTEAEDEKAETAEPKKETDKEERPEAEEDADTRYLRLMADFQNYRKRVEKEKSDIYSYANEKLITELLAVLDNFERAFDQEVCDAGFKEGMDMILKQLGDVLNKSGLAEIAALGEDFDPNYHNAVMTEETEEYESGKVSGVMQKGYTLNGKVIRPSMVKVVS
ncbi:MAG: nucleotide exchange factor GrpE [Clostridiales bacterium]|nr:nucleotide exchange factor GrpE [Clostridiales bacterium]